MTETTDPLRIPIAHSVRYAARGLPEVPNQYGDGILAPSEITLTYRAAPDSGLGRVHAYVAGRLWANGAEIPLLPGGLYGQHYDDGLDGWPEWLAEEARLHDPDATVPSAPAARPALPSSFVLWLDASDGSVPTHDGIVWPDGTATVHHRHFGYTITRSDPEAARQSAHGEQGRLVWPETAPADRAALRDRIAAAVQQCAEEGNVRYGHIADAVLAVLPAPTDRAAILREAADAVAALDRRKLRISTSLDSGEAWEEGCGEAEALLRRMADEAQRCGGQQIQCADAFWDGRHHAPHDWRQRPDAQPVRCPGAGETQQPKEA